MYGYLSFDEFKIPFPFPSQVVYPMISLSLHQEDHLNELCLRNEFWTFSCKKQV